MKVAIAGATGLTGNLCLMRLLSEPAVEQVITIGRKNTGISHTKLSTVLLTDNRLSEPVYADAFICCLGTTIRKAGSQEAFIEVDLRLPVYLASALKDNGCKTAAIVSAVGADPSSRIFYSRTKGQTEEAMKKIGFDSLSILRPSFIEGKRTEKRSGEGIGMIMMKIFTPLMLGSLSRFKPISAELIADTLVRTVVDAKPGTSVYFYKDMKA